MSPGGELNRAAPLVRKAPLRSKAGNAGLHRTPAKPKRPRDTGPTAKVRKLVFARADGLCEYPFCLGGIEQIHHRRPRRMGGSADPATNLPSNLVGLCQPHHALAESNRADALKQGLLLRAGDSPELVPVMLCHGLVLLDNDGGVTAIPMITAEEATDD